MSRPLPGSGAGKAAGLIIIALLLFTLAACSRVTQENYRRLQVGMEYSEVTAILGEPSRCDSVLTAKTCDWGKKERMITVRFVGDKAVFFSSKGI
ncbi:MAG TPA: outer membrane protein assembly factor BamE [Desulfobacteraceae bacterium]|nr:outer membrane protein assembly factor BamE [Desulfobacteraceae bacterium]